MKPYNTIITTVIGALLIGFIFFTTSGVADNSKAIAVNTNSLSNICGNIAEIKSDIKEIRNILIDKDNR